ncbi:MAG TPA: hypothetical protein VMT87_17370 [Vicinamibacteria bacterium]|nr:hypothetical protein [Vicinamibacteria bacterium]
MGPSTGAYLSGFTPSEERPPTTFRWATSRASVAVPLHGRGDGVLRFRAARFLDHPARIHAYAWGAPVATFEARPGGHRVYEFPLRGARGPLRLDFVAEDPELALAMDWIEVKGLGWRLPLTSWAPRLLVGGVFLVALLAGFGTAAAAAAAGGLALAQAAWAAADPFAFAHVAARVAPPALASAALLAWLARRREHGRFLVLIFLAGYLLKGAALFHPSYFYNDVRNNLRYVLALRDGEGRLSERNHAAQVRVGVAYPRVVAGRRYAFPYAPVFFLPFGFLPEERIVEAMKQVALWCASVEAVAVFALARVLGASGAGAALVSVLLPPLYSRLLLAMWSTVAGHLLDTVVVLATALLAARPDRLRPWLLQAGGTLAAFLTYISSLFNLTLFGGFAALLCRPLALRLLAGWAAAATFTVAWLYAGFVALFFREILPAAAAGARMAAEGGGTGGGVIEALARIPIFYGWGYPALAVAGFLLLARRAPPAVFRVLAAYALAAATLLALRAFGGGLFRDLKEIEFAAPLVALSAGAALEELARRGRAGRWAAALVLAGLVATSAERYAEYVRAYASLAGRP